MKKHFLIAFVAAMIFGATLYIAPVTSVATAGTEGSAMSDSWLTSKTKISLAADSRVKGTQVSVETKDGVVMLRGKVDSNEAKAAAEEITKGLDGVKSVKNELQVVSPSKRDMVEENDDNITKTVEKEIARDKHLKDASIKVHTNAGVVSLSGKVHDLSSSAQASWIARSVAGVKSVKNDLTVEKES